MSEEKVSPWYWPDLRSFVAIWMLGIFALVVAMLLFRPMPMTEQAGTLLLTIIGVIVAKVSSIVDFFFGSTKDSKEKDDTIRSQAVTMSAGAPVPVPPTATTTTTVVTPASTTTTTKPAAVPDNGLTSPAAKVDAPEPTKPNPLPPAANRQ